MNNIIASSLMGIGTGLALIVAIGAQNASDIALITAGVLGVGAVVERFPLVLVVLRFVGAAFLITYGVLAARRAMHPGALIVDDGVVAQAPGAADSGTRGGTRLTVESPAPLRAAVLTALAFTWLNPHVYLDTLVFAGSLLI